MARHFRSAATHQKVKVAALVGLHDVVDVQLAIAANQQVFWRFDVGQSGSQFGDIRIDKCNTRNRTGGKKSRS